LRDIQLSSRQDMRLILVAVLCLVGVNAKKLKHNPKALNTASDDMNTLKPKIAQLKADLANVYKCMNTTRNDPNWSTYCVLPPEETTFSSTSNQIASGRKLEDMNVKDRSTAATATDTFSIGDMYLTGYSTKCGPQTITGWTNQLDIYYCADANVATTCVAPHTNNADSTTSYVNTGSGTYTAPATGYYNICASLRFKRGGNAVDVTVYAGGSVVAGFGDAVDGDWRSTGTCFIRLLTAGNTVYLRNNSGGSSDCVEETQWRYGHLSVYMIGPSPA